MASEVSGDVVDVPRPVAILLEAAYIVLFAFGFLACVCTAGCLLWKFLGNGRPMFPSFLSAQAESDKGGCADEESGGERAGLEFEDDTDEEYMRRPY